MYSFKTEAVRLTLRHLSEKLAAAPQCCLKHYFINSSKLSPIYRQTVYICHRIKPDLYIVVFALYKYYIVFSRNQDMAA